MPPIEPGYIRAAGAVNSRAHEFGARAPGGAPGSPVKGGPRKAEVELSDAVDPGAPPVDAERVAKIKKAIEQGTYPVLPTRVADAIIAAGLLLRTAK